MDEGSAPPDAGRGIGSADREPGGQHGGFVGGDADGAALQVFEPDPAPVAEELERDLVAADVGLQPKGHEEVCDGDQQIPGVADRARMVTKLEIPLGRGGGGVVWVLDFARKRRSAPQDGVEVGRERGRTGPWSSS